MGVALGKPSMRESTVVMVVLVGGIGGTPCVDRYCRTDNVHKTLIVIKTFYNNLCAICVLCSWQMTIVGTNGHT